MITENWRKFRRRREGGDGIGLKRKGRWGRERTGGCWEKDGWGWRNKVDNWINIYVSPPGIGPAVSLAPSVTSAAPAASSASVSSGVESASASESA